MTPEESAAALRMLRVRIDGVERRWQHEVRVIGVTKGHGSWAIEAAVRAGCDGIGENYAQELVRKTDAIRRWRPVVSFIGRLQSNKVRALVGLVDVWSTLDRASVIDEVVRRAPGSRVLIQVDTTGDPAKGGCRVDDVAALVRRAGEQGLDVGGLMTVGPTGQPPGAARDGFRQVRSLVDDLGLEVCSMGMTADLDVAVAEGATEVRIGSALFGDRPPRP